MILENLYVRLEAYGPNEGKYTGQIRFRGTSGAVEIALSPNLSEAVLKLCGEALVTQAKETAGLMAANIIAASSGPERLTSS